MTTAVANLFGAAAQALLKSGTGGAAVQAALKFATPVVAGSEEANVVKTLADLFGSMHTAGSDALATGDPAQAVFNARDGIFGHLQSEKLHKVIGKLYDLTGGGET